MSFIKEIVERSMDIWETYLEHPFTTGMVDGTLDEERFKEYMIQDSIYIKEYGRVFAYGMYQSKTMKDIQMFYDILSFVQAGEASTRIKYLESYGLNDAMLEGVPMKKATQDYVDFMHDTATSGGILDTLMAVLPCLFTYSYIFKKLTKDGALITEDHPFAPFLKDYVHDGYKASCEAWGLYVNDLAEGIDEIEKERLLVLFRQASEHEVAFWDMAQQG